MFRGKPGPEEVFEYTENRLLLAMASGSFPAGVEASVDLKGQPIQDLLINRLDINWQ
jgi:hypothetical protein